VSELYEIWRTSLEPAEPREGTVRQKRERDQELLVWPDLVFIEFIAARVFTLAFVASVRPALALTPSA
jgi:hypothetical protein